MKLPKIDLSKDGLKRFFLHHVEKLILFLAIVGFAVFFWLGFKTDTFSETNPEQLSQKADSARSYIMNDASWESVDALRVTRDNADVIVQNTGELELDGYDFSKPLRGKPRQSLGLRYDPDIDLILPDPSVIESSVVSAPVFFQRDLIGGADKDELDKLDPAQERVSRRPGRGDDDEDSSSKKDDDGPSVGDVVSDLYQLVGAGLRGYRIGTSSSKDVSLIKNVVSVRALIKHKEFWENVKSKLKNTYGYFPERDRPNYKLLEFQRKEGDGSWKDRTLYQHRIESVYSGRAPEVVDPAFYDPALTRPIPPMPLVDYRSLANHSQVPLRNFDKFLKLLEPAKTEVVKADKPSQTTPQDSFNDPFNQGGDESDDELDPRGSAAVGPVRMGSDLSDYRDLDTDGPSGDFKVVRFFDLWDVKPGTTYTYRFRIWIDDPNHEADKTKAAAAGSDRGGDGGRGGRGGRGDRDEGPIGALGGGGGGGSVGLADDDGGGRGGIPGGERGGGFRGGGDPSGGGNPQGGRDPRGGRGGGSGNTPVVYKKVPIPDAQKHISVRNRIDDHLKALQNDPELKKFVENVSEMFNVDLTYCRATDWVEVTVQVPEVGMAETFIGDVTARQTRSPRREPVTVTDQIARVLVSEWSGALGTLVSTFREVRKGDWLNFDIESPTNVLHIVNSQMVKLKDYQFQTGQMVVDLMGGESIDVGRISPAEYQMPSEILLMDEDGNVIVHNSFDEKREYLLRSQATDETAEYNLDKRRSNDSSGRGDDDDDLFK